MTLLAEPRTQQPDLVSIYLAEVRNEVSQMPADERIAHLKKLRVRLIAASERYSGIIERGEFGLPLEASWDYAGVVKGIEGMIGEQS